MDTRRTRVLWLVALSLSLLSAEAQAQAEIANATPGVCYATTGGGAPGNLITIDLATGAGTLVGPTGISNGMPSLAIDSQGRLFASGHGNSGDFNLYRLDADSGDATLVGSLLDGFSQIDFGGLAFDSTDRLIGAAPFLQLYYEVDTDTAGLTFLSDMEGTVTGLSYGPDGLFYGTSGRFFTGDGIGPDELGTVDPVSGSATVLGSFGTGIDGTPGISFDAAGNLWITKGGGNGTQGGGARLYAVDTTTTPWTTTAADSAIGFSASGFECYRGAVVEPPVDPPVDPEAKVYVCHKQGKSGKQKTLLIDPESLQDHLDHGDEAGSCEDPAAGKSLALATVPESFSLSQNYPNPFNPTTSITFALPEASAVRLAVYNAVGQEVKLLVSASLEAGVHTVSWDGTDRNGGKVSTGVYLYRISAGNVVQTRKMTLLE